MEAFTTTTHPLGIGIVEHKLLCQFCLYKVHFCSQQSQLSFLVQENPDSFSEQRNQWISHTSKARGSLTILNYFFVEFSFLSCIFHGVRESIAASCSDPHSQSNLCALLKKNTHRGFIEVTWTATIGVELLTASEFSDKRDLTLVRALGVCGVETRVGARSDRSTSLFLPVLVRLSSARAFSPCSPSSRWRV